MTRFRWCVAAAASAGLLACGSPAEQSASTELASQEQRAAGELNTNILRVRALLTNQNPQVLELIALQPSYSTSARADSTQPTGYTATSSDGVRTSLLEFNFEMLVEAGAGGANGVRYRVSAGRSIGNSSFQFPPVDNVVVRTPDVQPAPTQVQLDSCVGVLQFSLGQDSTCTTAPGDSRSMSAGIGLFERQGKYLGFVRGGVPQNISVFYTVRTGTTVYSNSTTVQATAGCDEIVPVCIVAQQPPPPPDPLPVPPLGGLSGPWELSGETPISRSVNVLGGPRPDYSNRTRSDTTPSAPISEPSTWWSLGSLAEGSGYRMTTSARLGPSRHFMEVNTGYAVDGISVIANQTTPVTRVVDGVSRYPYVMQPAYLHGELRLVDPYVTQHPGAPSSLQSLMFSADFDANGDGIPDRLMNQGTYLSASSSPSATNGSVGARFNPATGELASQYELVLASPFNLRRTWTQALVLRFEAGPQGGGAGAFILRQNQNTHQLGAGERGRIDHAYCFNEVQLDYWTALGRLYNPRALINGGFTGTDWRGRPAAYQLLSGDFTGTPSASQPATRGSIRMSLPEGTYTVARSAVMVNANGQTNNANFSPLPLVLGCGQRLKIVPPHTVSIAPNSECSATGEAPVSGIVRSSGTEVDRIWYQVNGGPEVTLCTNCGIEPTFSFTVPLQACANEIRVFAFTEGMPEASSGAQQIVWDDPNDGPSCEGSACVARTNLPPVARCQDVTVVANGTCSGCGSVNASSYDPDPGDTITCVQSPECASGVGSRQVTLTCTDSEGVSSSCTAMVTVEDQTPPTLICPAPIVVQATEPEGAQVTPGTATVGDACSTPQVSGPQAGTYVAGTHTVTYTATDGAGNQATCNSTIQVLEAPNPPTVTLGNQPRYTQLTHHTLWGYATPGVSGAAVTEVYFTVDGGPHLAPTTVNPVGGYNNVEVDLAEGTHVIEMVAIDAAGVRRSRTTTITVDLTPPVLTVLSPTAGQELSSPVVQVVSSVTDVSPTRVWTQWVMDSEVPSGTGTVTHQVDLVNRGDRVIFVRAVDAAGNVTERFLQVFIGPEPLSPLARDADVAPQVGMAH
ncbi:HYR domain-containing protein [Pyxidicoccus xibeiensis]|uniref:HYR domain-containing protein n=1 Tax=Pyxidicoccus xibeiensis TaxID=2906759 RepID=UPI0020A741C7|nr:HYR domain-containing protein [Pyxidicoccus xibeiensis]MCP3138158.1 HYR domain-containing protein [Pyxidicoccus xibeiensis]